jgi:hypothetical protein
MRPLGVLKASTLSQQSRSLSQGDAKAEDETGGMVWLRGPGVGKIFPSFPAFFLSLFLKDPKPWRIEINGVENAVKLAVCS